ncbi:nitrous oxide reductase accessory protein NosL [Castellaniella sp. GW247-6E4]|uniref:nitrous oxide reductase accessory protein NosL n=1 Tax=Castellaniella sp. GW247-6E4 TaxID=3140380 RepID=UPI0033163352
MKNASRRLFAPATLTLVLLLAGCGGNDATQPPPAPHAITSEAVGHYCGMNLDEHTGPKGQILLRDTSQPVWFTTIRQVFAYTLLPEEPKAIRAIYVQDMGRAPAGGSPPSDAWIDAREAYYLIEGGAIGGMGAPDALPFLHEEDAQASGRRHGGRVVRFEDMPEDYILGDAATAPQNPHVGHASVGASS